MEKRDVFSVCHPCGSILDREASRGNGDVRVLPRLGRQGTVRLCRKRQARGAYYVPSGFTVRLPAIQEGDDEEGQNQSGEEKCVRHGTKGSVLAVPQSKTRSR